MKTLLLIDANSLIHRLFHALPSLTAPDGRPIGALYGLASILLKLWREEKPDYVAACFDRPEPTFRKQEYAEYKAQRPPTPDALIPQLAEAHKLFSRFGVHTFESPGFEADDLIATMAERFKNDPSLRIVILTGDSDTLQLVEGNKVIVRTFKKGVSETTIYNEQSVRDRYGIAPAQLVDYKAFVGDASDNIPGVRGVGPKTAAALLVQYGSIEGVYDAALRDRMLREKVGDTKDDTIRAKRLIILRRDAPIAVGDVCELSVRERQGELLTYFKEIGFETLVKRIEEQGMRGLSAQGIGAGETKQGTFF